MKLLALGTCELYVSDAVALLLISLALKVLSGTAPVLERDIATYSSQHLITNKKTPLQSFLLLRIEHAVLFSLDLEKCAILNLIITNPKAELPSVDEIQET